MSSIQNFFSAFLSGIVIALGGAASLYLKADSPIAAAIMFSLGFIVIGVFELSIFTDNLGGIFSKKTGLKQLKKNLILWLGNILGAGIIGVLMLPHLNTAALELMVTKFELSLSELAINSVLCGMLIYIAMHGFRKAGSGFTGCAVLFLASYMISAFGFEYAVTNILYIASAFNNLASYEKNIGEILVLTILVAVGNAIGAIVFSGIYKLKNESIHHRHSHRHHSDSENH